MILFVAYCVSCVATNTYADSSKSTNFTIDESVVGVGSMNIGSSANYQAVNSTGNIAIGNSASGNYQVEAGATTTPDPALSFIVNNGNINFGSFTPSAATVTTATFSVINYTSFGYVVQIVGNPPDNNGHTIPAMATTDSSHIGTEQFGINLVANTLPVSVGANPDNGSFGFGVADANYGTSNQYRYVSGETIASAPKSSGRTDYTISYLINVAGLTPGGQYSSNQTIIITGTY